jgi:hypothetical protein
VQTPAVVPAFDSREDRGLRSRRVGQERGRASSFLSVAKMLSQTTLSSAQPLALIETAIPVAQVLWPKLSDTYCPDSTGPRQTVVSAASPLFGGDGRVRLA